MYGGGAQGQGGVGGGVVVVGRRGGGGAPEQGARVHVHVPEVVGGVAGEGGAPRRRVLLGEVWGKKIVRFSECSQITTCHFLKLVVICYF